MTDIKRATAELAKKHALVLASLPDGFDAFCIADLTRALAPAAEDRAVVLVHVARDEQRARAFREALAFAAPEIEMLDFPGWDCQPYDRVSPNAAIAARRMTVLARLARSRSGAERPRILSTTVNAILSACRRWKKIAAESFSAAPGNAVDMDEPRRNGSRTTASPAPPPCAIPANMPCAAAFSIFSRRRWRSRCGSISSAIRWNRSAPSIPRPSARSASCAPLDLVPMSEVQLTSETMRRFRQGYVALFGAQTRGDTLYEAVSEGRRHPGLEHWLPLFYDGLDTLVRLYRRRAAAARSAAEEAAQERFAQIHDYYDARKSAHDSDPANSPYKPLPPDALYLPAAGMARALGVAAASRASRLSRRRKAARTPVIDCGGRLGRNFAPERADENANVFHAAVEHVRALQAQGKRVVVAGWSDGSRERLGHVLKDFGIAALEPVSSFGEALRLPKSAVALAVIGLEAASRRAISR